MRNRVMITETIYKVDETNKVVLCILKCNMQLDKHPSWNHIATNMFQKHLPHVNWEGKFSAKGKAKCNAKDMFDIIKGKRIAESRAKVKMFKTAGQVYSYLATALLNLAQACNNSEKACTEALKKEILHVQDLTEVIELN